MNTMFNKKRVSWLIIKAFTSPNKGSSSFRPNFKSNK